MQQSWMGFDFSGLLEAFVASTLPLNTPLKTGGFLLLAFLKFVAHS